jgi:hypothetical protein
MVEMGYCVAHLASDAKEAVPLVGCFPRGCRWTGPGISLCSGKRSMYRNHNGLQHEYRVEL